MGFVKITLRVEAETLYNMPKPKESDIVNLCGVEWTGGIIDKGKMKDSKFYVAVKPKDRVEWSGTAVKSDGNVDALTIQFPERDKNYKISIDLVSYQFKGDNYFIDNVLLGQGGSPKKVKADVDNLNPEGADLYWYTIFFTIHPKFGFDRSFFVDPKLRIT